MADWIVLLRKKSIVRVTGVINVLVWTGRNPVRGRAVHYFTVKRLFSTEHVLVKLFSSFFVSGILEYFYYFFI